MPAKHPNSISVPLSNVIEVSMVVSEQATCLWLGDAGWQMLKVPQWLSVTGLQGLQEQLFSSSSWAPAGGVRHSASCTPPQICLQKMETEHQSPASEEEKEAKSNYTSIMSVSGPCLPSCTTERNIFINYFVNVSFLVALETLLKGERIPPHLKWFGG